MEKPFTLIDCRMAERREFQLTDGIQPTWALLHIREGSFTLDYGCGAETISAGDTVIFSDNDSFRRRVVEPIAFVYIRFRVNLACPFALDVPVGRVTVKDRARFLSTLAAWEAVMPLTDRRSRYYKEHLLEDMLFQLFMENNKPSEAELPTACGDPMTGAAMRYIRENIAGDLSIGAVSAAAETNPSTLNWRFRRSLGMSPGQYITAVRMETARRLLLGTNFTVTDIAARCGYENVYYFSAAFRRACGMPPSVYREEN